MKTSFAPRDAAVSSTRWEGGLATITNPRFEYRDVDFKRGRGEEKMVTLFLDYLDQNGETHEATFDVDTIVNRNTEEHILVIRESPEQTSDEAEVGPSFSHIDSEKTYRIWSGSQFFTFLTALKAAGVSESKLETGDIRSIDGLEVVVTPKAKKDGDRFPLLLPFELQQKPTASKSAKPPAKSAAKPSAPIADATDDAADAEEVARELMVDMATDSPTIITRFIMKATAMIDDKATKSEVVRLLQSVDFHNENTALWSYDAKKKTVTAA